MATLLYKTRTTIRLHDIDAAGVVFFARYFYFAHNAYEAWLDQQRFSVKKILESGYILPVVHTQAEYKRPVSVNDTLVIKLFLREQRRHSFCLEYQFVNTRNQLVALLQTTHVYMDGKTRQKVPLPKVLFGE